MDYMKIYKKWCENPYFDQETREELLGLKGDEKEIQDRFYRELEFGTGGLRGVMGAGTNRMNRYTVRKATQGLANYILKKGGTSSSVAIAYDSRLNSEEFSLEAAMCFAANGIQVYRFESLRPTPELSFAVRKLGCIAGIVITASHNPSEYNGYKVYWEDGAQITAPLDKEIISEVNSVTDYSLVKTMEVLKAEELGLYQVIGEEIDQDYMKELLDLRLEPDAVLEAADSLKIVYTPLHGAGNVLVQEILKEMGFQHVYIVKGQEQPDGRFPTVASPNPEDKRAFEMALALAKEVDADLVLATDPDADRLGVYVKDVSSGDYIEFSGNMTGILICEYILNRKKQKKLLKDSGIDTVVKTIVTTNMADAVTKEYGVSFIEVLTGFKYIGEKIKEFEGYTARKYVFGFEESYGCLIGTYARDKDAVSAVMILCEMAAYYKTQGMSLWDQMMNLYERYGFYKESLSTVTYKGIEGVDKIKGIMSQMRQNPITKAAGKNVLVVRDYETGIKTELITGDKVGCGLPKSDVLYFELEDDAWFCVRPSGTEPKIKFYFGVKGNSLEDASQLLKQLEEDVLGDM